MFVLPPKVMSKVTCPECAGSERAATCTRTELGRYYCTSTASATRLRARHVKLPAATVAAGLPCGNDVQATDAMVVYTVRGLQDGEVCSIRKFLDVELGEFNRKLLLRKSTEAGRNSVLDLATRRDIDLLETVDEDELFELLIQDYLLGISRRLFVQKFRSLDRDGTHRVWARDVKGLLHELVVQRAEKLHEEELNIHRSGVSGKNLRNLRIDSQASLTGDSRHVSRQGSRWDVLAGASARSKSAVLSTRNLRFMEETSTASNGGDAPPTVVSPGSAAPGETRQSNAVYVRYSVQDLKVIEEMQRPTETSRHARQAEGQRLAQEADQRSPGERDRAHTTPSSLIGRDPFQERPYTLQVCPRHTLLPRESSVGPARLVSLFD